MEVYVNNVHIGKYKVMNNPIFTPQFQGINGTNIIQKALTDEQKAKMAAHKTACIAETGVDQQLVENAKNGNIADDDKLFCFVLCVMKKIGIMTDDGNVNVELAKQKLLAGGIAVEKIDEINNRCAGLDGPTPCKKAGNIIKCLAENKFGILH